ncbi:leucine-rich repeat-containing protein 74B isoform X2 [Tyto alba]|uniref:leucine-rich repeat-containing protein 74B isoform X2 n=1 Tax=Tyto alba TaxID=56313 RepID=UPI001C6670F0|nr:leucine-rich repeat-containing protein 74B isoform X2 [Tyto alba]
MAARGRGGPAGDEDGGGLAEESRYLAACRACGVSPASSLLRRRPGPALRLRHRGLGPRVRDGSASPPRGTPGVGPWAMGGARRTRQPAGTAPSGTPPIRVAVLPRQNQKPLSTRQPGDCRLCLSHWCNSSGYHSNPSFMARACAGALFCLPCKYQLGASIMAPEGAKALALSLMVDTSILTLDLSDNWLQGEGAAAIAEMLKENCYISDVDLSDNKLGVEGAKALSAMLLENTTVVSLQLSGNEFDDHAAKYLADAITANSKVEILDLSYNMFGDKGAEILGMAIAENVGLKEFKISWNHFHSHGAAALAKGLGANIFLKVLDVSYNGFGNSGAAALGEALKANNVLEELNVSNRILVEGALHIAAGLKQNKTLKRLSMIRNPMQSEGCCGVLKALQENSGTGIEILDLPDIPVNKELAELCDAVKILFPDLLLRYGGNVKLQRKSQSKAELWTQPKVVGNLQDAVV